MDVLAAFTIGSAYVNHLDDVTGSIEVGKLADLVGPGSGHRGRGAERIGNARVLLTLVEGEPSTTPAPCERGSRAVRVRAAGSRASRACRVPAGRIAVAARLPPLPWWP